MHLLMLRLGLLLPLLCSVNSNISQNDIDELVYLDTDADPCEDFYQFTCGNFKAVHSLPSDANIIDHFTLLENELIEIGQEILSSPKNANDPIALKKAKSAYRGCVNVDSTGIVAPDLRLLAEFGNLPFISPNDESESFSWNEIGDLVAKYGVPLVFSLSVAQTEQTESVVYAGPDLLSNPSLFRPKYEKTYEEILEEDFRNMVRSRKTREISAFDIFLRTVLFHLRDQINSNTTDDQIIEDIDEMRSFMSRLYSGGIVDGEVMPLVEFPPTLRQLQNWTDLQFGGEANINWIEYLGRVFQMTNVKVNEDIKFYHQGLEQIYGVINLVKQTDPKVLKNFALLRVILFQAPDSDLVVRTAFENYYTSRGVTVYSRPQYCTRKILDVVDTAGLSYAATYAYKHYYYNINKILQAYGLVNNITNTFKEILTTVDWMDQESRSVALAKVDNILVLLGYPEFVEQKQKLDAFYENFPTCEWDNYGNARNIRAFRQAYQFTQLGTPDRNFWGKSAFDPNAYYNRPNNKIVLPIAMLNPVFFYGNNPVLDYSRLGSVIGHEITHGFDQNGKNYNQDGLLDSWWSDDTMSAFEEKANCFKQQYSNYNITDTFINGNSSVNENLADGGGIRLAFKAFQTMVKDRNLTADGQYTLEQLFFIGYGTMWCSEESNYYLQAITASTSSYPPNRYRVIGSLSNMEEFSKAFNCPAGSYMNPENKCLLW